MGKKRELEISLSDFRRRPLHYLDRAYKTKEPILIFRRKRLVGIVWKSYGPKKIRIKYKYWSVVLGAMEIQMAGQGYDLRGQLGFPPLVRSEAKGGKPMKGAGPRRSPKKQQ